MPNYFRYDVNRGTFSFCYLNADCLCELSADDRAEYERQLVLFESPDHEDDPELDRLCNEAQSRAESRTC